MSKLTEEEKDRQVEIEIQTAKSIANKLYKVVNNKEFVKEVPDAITRHQVVTIQLKKMDQQEGTQMYESFANAYPVVLKYMAQQLSYNEIAFEKFLRKQAQDPGKGMEGFIEHQANYVKLLYVESCKAARKRPNLKEANKRKNAEFEVLNKVRKDMETSKKKAENEFDAENLHHLDEKRKELLDFVNEELETLDPLSDDEDIMSNEDEDVEESRTVTDEEFFNSLTRKEQKVKLETYYFLERTTIKELADKDKEIRELEKAVVAEKKKAQDAWLDGTILKKSKTKTSSTNKTKKTKKSKK